MQQSEATNFDPQPLALQNGAGPQAPPPPQAGMDGISLQDFLAIIRRRQTIVLQSFVIISVVTVIWTFLTKPVYQASSQLLVESSSPTINTVDESNPFSEILALSQPQSVSTQVQELQSPSLQFRALHYPEYEDPTRPNAPKLTPSADDWKKDQNILDYSQRFAPSDPVTGTTILTPPLPKPLRATFTVKEVNDTNVIEITTESTSAPNAAVAANRLLHDYIYKDASGSQNDVTAAMNFVQSQQKDAQRILKNTELLLELFKLKNHVADLATDRSQESAQLSTIVLGLQQSQAQLSAMDSQIAALRGELNTVPAALTADVQTTNKNIDSLKQKIGDLQLQREGLTQPGGYTPSAPQVRAIDAQILQLQRRLATEPTLSVSKTVSPNIRQQEIRNKIGDMLTQRAALKAQITQMQHQVNLGNVQIGRYANWEVSLARLQRDHDDAFNEVSMLSSKLTDLNLRAASQHKSAQVLEPSTVPNIPVRPKKTLNILMGALFGLFLGICMALLQEYLDDRINTVEDANRVIGLPSLGYVPALTSADAKLLPQMRHVDPAAESYRLLRTNIQFAAIDTPLRTLLVTSTAPGEGKTTTTANLAFAMALDGKKVLLVDTDLRRPTMHKLLEVPSGPGLTDVLLGRAKLEDTILPNPSIPNLRTLSAGALPPNPAELLNSHAFDVLTSKMAEMHDIVIFDSPPVLVAADAAIMASKFDGTVLVVANGDTKKGPARQAMALLTKARANVLGIAFNKMRATDGQGYGYYYYQYSSTPSLESGDDAKSDKKELTTEAVEK